MNILSISLILCVLVGIASGLGFYFGHISALQNWSSNADDDRAVLWEDVFYKIIKIKDPKSWEKADKYRGV